MNVASLELCKELFELSGWDGTHMFYDAENDAVESRRALLMHPTNNCPAYSLDYLIRKLPTTLEMAELTLSVDPWSHNKWKASYLAYYPCTNNSPEDALCALAIALHEENILQKGSAA